MSYADPERIDYIEELERRVNEKRGEGKAQATFFKSKRRDKKPMGIREIVEWSRMNRRGVYLDDQEDIEQEGCMRWGLCERPKEPQIDLFEETSNK